MKKFVCSVCGYVYEGEAAPKECPICHVPSEKFNKVEETAITWADEHKVGVAEGLDEEVVAPWLVEMVKQKTIYYPAYGK